MPALNLDALDDPMGVDACATFFGGQNSFLPPDQLGANQAAEMVNIDIEDNTATTRRGTLSLGRAGAATRIQGMCWYDTPAHEYLMIAVGGKIYSYDGNTFAELDNMYAAVSTTGPVYMAQVVDKVYIADGTSNLFEWDGSTMNDLGNTTGNPGDPPSKGLYVITASFRLWMAGFSDAPDTLWASKIGDATAWYATEGNIRIGQGEGDPITGLCEWDGYKIVVFKRNSIYIVTCSPTLTGADSAHSLTLATVTKISDTIGCVSARSIVRVGPDIYFLSDAGVYSIGRVLAQDERELKPPLSLAVQDIIDRINMEAVSTANGFFWKHRYFLALPLDDETTPASVLVYNVHRQGWSGLWTGWSPTCWALSKASGLERLNFGRSDGKLWRWLDYVADPVDSTWQDNATNVATSLKTRAMIFNDAVSPKSLLSVEFEFFQSEALADVAMALDEQEAISLHATFDTGTGALTLPFTLPATLPSRGIRRRAFGAQQLPQFRSAQAVVSSTAGKLALRAVIATGFIDTVQLEA